MSDKYYSRRSVIGRLINGLFFLAGSKIFVPNVSATNIKIDQPAASEEGEWCGLYGGSTKKCTDLPSTCDQSKLHKQRWWKKCCCMADGWQCCSYQDLCGNTADLAAAKCTGTVLTSGSWCNSGVWEYVCTIAKCQGTLHSTAAACSPTCTGNS